jgi:haloalkane dehalogenase
LIEQNLFVEQMLPGGVKRPLKEEEMLWYRKPFLDPSSREPVYRFPNEIPLDEHPADVWAMSKKYMEWLSITELPKLWFWVTPGVFIMEDKVKELKQQLHNAKAVFLGEGIHYVQEDYPHEIGREISLWLKTSASM